MRIGRAGLTHTSTLPLPFPSWLHPAFLVLIHRGKGKPWGVRKPQNFASVDLVSVPGSPPCCSFEKLIPSSHPHLILSIKWKPRDLAHSVMVNKSVYNVKYVLLRVIQTWFSSRASCRATQTTHMHVPFISSNHCLPPPTDTLTPLETGMEMSWNCLYCDVSWILKTEVWCWGVT